MRHVSSLRLSLSSLTITIMSCFVILPSLLRRRAVSQVQAASFVGTSSSFPSTVSRRHGSLGLGLATTTTPLDAPVRGFLGRSVQPQRSSGVLSVTASACSSRLRSTAVPVDDVDAVSSSSSMDDEVYLLGELLPVTSELEDSGVVIARIVDDVVGIGMGKGQGQGRGQGHGDVPEIVESMEKAKVGVSKTRGGGGGQGDNLLGRSVLFVSPSSASSPSTVTTTGVVVAQRHPMAFILCDDASVGDLTEHEVRIMPERTKIGFRGEGATVDYLGRSLSGVDAVVLDATAENSKESSSSSSSSSSSLPIFSTIPTVAEIALINEPLLTGVSAVDALTPIGKGQNMLIVGRRQRPSSSSSDKEKNDGEEDEGLRRVRAIAVDAVHTQAAAGTACVYASTSSSSSFDTRELDTLPASATRVHSRSRSPAEAVCVAAAACTLGEIHARQGRDALVVIDTVDLHQNFWDDTTRAVVDLYGSGAVSGGPESISSEARAFYAELVQRAARFKGGGSLTLLLLATLPPPPSSSSSSSKEGNDSDSDSSEETFPLETFEGVYPEKILTRLRLLREKGIDLTASVLQKLGIPLPDAAAHAERMAISHVEDLISMTDGQIWLSDDGGKLDVTRSVTRVGIGADTPSRADAPALQELTAGMRVELAQVIDMMEESESNPSDVDRWTRRRGQAWAMALNQDRRRSLAETCAVVLAVRTGLLDGMEDKAIETDVDVDVDVGLVEGLLRHVARTVPDTMEVIDRTLDFGPGGRETLEEAVRNYLRPSTPLTPSTQDMTKEVEEESR